jgi:hypothetical protein
VLVVLTVVVIFQATSTPADTAQQSAPPAGSTSTAPSTPAPSAADAPGTVAEPTEPAAPNQLAAVPGAVPDLTIRDADGHLAASIAAAALPAGPEFVAAGAGTWHVVPGTAPTHGAGEQAHTYSIEVEDGLQSADQDAAFASAVDAILADPRSWIGGGQVSLTRIDTGDPDFRISLTSQLTIRAPDQCGWEVPLEASCFNGYADRVFINVARWVRGAMSFGGDIESYRSYAVNHEVGHALGMRHEPCPGTGQPAPVMMQQSWSTSDDDLSLLDPQTIPRDGNVCVANPYPFPGAQAVAPDSPAATAAAG